MANFDLSAFTPDMLSGDTQKLFQLLAQSPMFQAMLQQNALAGQQLGSNVQAGLAARGLNTSGIGTLANSAAQSATSFGETGIRGDLFHTALMTALQNYFQKMQLSGQYQIAKVGQPTGLERIGGALIGAAGTALPFFAGKSPFNSPNPSLGTAGTKNQVS